MKLLYRPVLFASLLCSTAFVPAAFGQTAGKNQQPAVGQHSCEALTTIVDENADRSPLR